MGADSSKPNVIMILVDALRADRLGCYGYDKALTPNIDKLANNSLLFENAYSNSPSTVRSVASLFTSTLPIVHRISEPPTSDRPQLAYLDDGLLLMPEVFKEHGYKTAMITGSGWITPEVNYDQGVDEYVVLPGRGDRYVLDEAKAFLVRNRHQPFFLYLHLLDLHDYYHSAILFDKYPDLTAAASPQLLALRGKSPSDIYHVLRAEPDRFTWADAQLLSEAYDRELKENDNKIGLLIGALQRAGLLQDTMVVLVSDHGEQFLEHGHLVHGGDGFFKEVLRIPFIISWEGFFQTQTVIDRPVSLIDVLPTLLDIIQVDSPPVFQGKSGLETTREGALVLSTNGRTWRLTNERWSYIYSRRYDREELYDLDRDPIETTNLVSQQKVVATEFRERLAHLIALSGEHEYSANSSEPETVEASPEVLKTLKSLGYIK